MWVAGAIVGSAVVGAVASNASTNTASNASAEATAATTDATTASIASTEGMYNQNREDLSAYRNLASRSLANLESDTYGTTESYNDTNYKEATQDEINAANKAWLSSDAATPGDLPYKTGMYIGPNGQIVGKNDVPQVQTTATQFDLANFKPEETEAYKWQKANTLEDLGNYYNLTGRGRGSTGQTNATTNALGDLNASEYTAGYNRLYQRKQDYTNSLLNLVKTAQGSANSTTSSGTAAAASTSNAYTNQGNTLASIATDEGTTKANLYSGVVPSTLNTVSTGLQLNNYTNNSGDADIVDPFGTNYGRG